MEPISGALDQFGQDTDPKPQALLAEATVDQPADSDGKTRETASPSSERVETTFEEPALLADRNVEVYGRASALLFINDKQLPGFHHDYVKRLGRNSVAPGLCVEVRPRWGPNTESVLSLKLLIRDGNVSYPFAYIEINMSKLEEVVSTQVFSTTESDAINRLITPGIQSFPGAVEVINPEEKHRDLFNDVEESASLAEYIRTATSSFASASVIVNAGHVTQVYPPSFWGSLATFPASLQTIVRDVRALIQQSLQPHSVIKWVVISPAIEGWNKRWDLFKSRDIRRGAYQAFTCACRGGNINDLDYENTTFDDVDRTDSCGGAARAFISRDERTVSLVVGAADEGMCKIKQAIACAETTFPAAMFPVPNSEWKAKPSDLEIGTRAELFLNVGQRPHPVPPIRLSPGQAADLAMKLQNHFAASIDKAHNKLVDAEDMYDKLVRMKASEEEIAKQQDYIDTVYENTYMEYATANVLGYISRISDHITHETPNATDDVRRWVQAQLIAQELRAQPGEDEIAHFNRIQTWLAQQRNIIRPLVNQRQDEPWKGFRVNLPAGVREDIALFYVEVPLQVDWPCGFERPPFIVDAPRKVPLYLGTYFANITRGEKKILARIEYDVNDKSLCYEANAINVMNNVKDNSSAAAWWEYILAFDPDLITRELDLWARFPGIADGAANGRFVGRHLEAACMLKKTRQGKVIITGGPGSGKTYFGTLIAQAVVEGGVVDTSRTCISIPSAASMTWAELERQWNRQTNALRKALVVWTAPQDAQVLDATTRLHKTIPGSIIIKVHTWKAEVAALLDAGVRIPELMEPRPNATATERTIARLVNAFRKKEFNQLSPATNPYSISSQLRARAMANPGANRLLFDI
ncbi:hypothetical protein TGAM01_v210344 [Trichoderma gamsii]|uniref:DNA2/NAM7 helicase helicase domain-containing protein n=1 Tax=Trichoderma gamsii TaxID=398673 RepID=A0A2P4Z8X4_9HYPO|nr:hypothetical protein TGAM01_v210344 [Trichoderma gamsii]PON20743.1 hypothetical protein TGAM01_v210344 [Trichoderma gamsii]